MQAITVRDREAGLAGLSLTGLPDPHAAQNDVIVRVHALGSPRGSWAGRGRGLIGPAGAGRRVCPGMRCRVSSLNWAGAPRV